jgi:hypothetical protein
MIVPCRGVRIQLSLRIIALFRVSCPMWVSWLFCSLTMIVAFHEYKPHCHLQSALLLRCNCLKGCPIHLASRHGKTPTYAKKTEGKDTLLVYHSPRNSSHATLSKMILNYLVLCRFAGIVEKVLLSAASYLRKKALTFVAFNLFIVEYVYKFIFFIIVE